MQGVFIKRLASLPWIVKVLLLGSVYWLFCWIGTLTFYKDFGIAIYWPATGIAIAGVYVLGRSSSLGLFVVSFFMNYFIYKQGYSNNLSLFMSILAIAAGNTLGAVLGSRWLDLKVLRNGRSFFRLDSVLAFLLFVAFIPSLITSLTGGVVTFLSGAIPELFLKIHTWMLADLVGVIVLVPLFFAWVESPMVKIVKSKLPEFIVILLLLGFTGYFIFSGFFENYFYNFLIASFTTPLYFWLALRFNSKLITSVQVASLVFISYLAIYKDHTFIENIIDRPFVLIQGFSILVSVLILLVHSIYMEKQQIIASLHKSEQDMKDVLENLPLSLGILNKSAEPEFLNNEFKKKTGLSLKDFRMSEFDPVPASSDDQSVNLLRNAWESYIEIYNDGEIRERDISILGKNHSERIYSLNISPLKDRYLMVMMDVTQRKRMLERIKEDERRLSSLIQNLQGMVYQCRFDRNWTMEFVSEGSFLLTGYLPSELIYNSHVPFVSIIHERYRNYVWESIEKAVKKGEMYSLQYQIISKSGELKWVSENGNGIFGTDGVCRSLEGFIYDITDRVAALEALQKGEEKYHSLFENMPVSLWEDDYSEVKKYLDSLPDNLKEDLALSIRTNRELYQQITSKIVIVDMNRVSLNLYSASSKEKLRESVSEIFASSDPEPFSTVIASFYYGKSILEERIMEVRIKKKKQVHFVSWLIMPGHEKDLSRVLVTILDITNLKNAEKEIRLLNQNLEKKVKKRTEDLDRANQELEAFSYSVSHDLKAPLRAVRGFSSLLMQEYAPSLPEGAIHYIKNVQKNSENMTLLITDLFHFSRLGRKHIVYTTFDSFQLVNTILTDLYSLHKPEKTEFVINPLPVMTADENLLTQVFVNLFSNAVKFSKPGLENRIEVSCKSDPGYHEFCVYDQGIGFDQKYSEKIFKVFQRLHSSDEFEGTGVGLSLVQRIIHRHRGTTWAESEVGKGTRIFFRIPVEIDSE